MSILLAGLIGLAVSISMQLGHNSGVKDAEKAKQEKVSVKDPQEQKYAGCYNDKAHSWCQEGKSE